jgi:hypothetical protein
LKEERKSAPRTRAFTRKERKEGMRRERLYMQIQIIILDSTSREVCSMIEWLGVFFFGQITTNSLKRIEHLICNRKEE